jgi:hypothetical protein
MRFGFLLRDIPNKDVPRQEPRRPFGRAIVNKALLLHVGIPSLSFNGLDGDTHAGSQASGSCANLNTPIGTQVPWTVLTLIYPDAVSIPILCHLRHILMMLRNPSGLCRNLQMLYRIPI